MSKNVQLIAVLENPNYIINIGSVIRNINGLGVDKLFVIDGLHRLENNLEEIRKRKSILKHSNGAVKSTIIEVFNSSESCFEYLKENGFISIGTSPHNICKQQIQLEKANLTQPKLAIWFGSESKGLSEAVLKQCEYCLTIKMKGEVESLNLSTTTGIVLFEAVKQRENLK